MPSCLIAGASGGVGSALAGKLSAAGWQLVLCGRREDALHALAARLEGPALVVPADCRKADEVAGLYEAIAKQGWTVDALAHCVGSIVVKPLHLQSEQDAREVFDVNYWSAFHLLKGFVQERLARQEGGVAVVTASLVVNAGFPGHEAIASAKSALLGLMMSAAASYAGKGIRVNAVAPGLTDTPLAARFLANEAMRARMAAMNPSGRVGRPEDVAGAMAFLLSGDAGWMTGQTLTVDGGHSGLIVPPAPGKPA